ncbi:MAG: hypothetical protein QY306_02340 [Anaerolineales bacterium]|nr:MAG: hypothetical protein QY306_02340 [Anaerolineales bacterium]
MVNRGAGWHPAKLGGLSIRPTMLFLFLIPTLFIVSCNPSTVQSPLQVVSVHSTSAAEPWLTDLYACADSIATLVRVDDATSADIALRIGEPEFLSGFAYQIGEEEILVVTNRQSPIQNLDKDGVQALFMGLGDPSVQVWVYASDADAQRVFDQFVMEERSVASSALVVANPQQMLESLNGESNSVGILPRHWVAGDLRDVYSVATVPVLALTKSEPVGVVNQLIGCLQK